MRGCGRSGVALVSVLAGLLLLTLAAHGALVLARAEHAAARSGVAWLQARVAADAGMATVRSVEEFPETAVGESVALASSSGPARYAARAVRLGPESWRLESEGRDEAARVAVRTRALAWRLDPVTRVDATTATLVLGPGAGLALEGRVVGRGAWPGAGHSRVPASCVPWAAALDSLGREDWRDVAWDVGWDAPWAPEAHALGHLTWADLEARLAPVGGAAARPEPRVDAGRCLVEDPWNWGDPGEPGGPCTDHLVARFASGNLRIQGGVGQGLLAVRGDLSLAGQARFRGLVLVGGTLTLEAGAELFGAARAGRAAVVRTGAELHGAACALLSAVALQELRAPVVVAGGGRLEP